MWTRHLWFPSVDVSGTKSRPWSQYWRWLFMSHRVRRFLPAKQTNHGKPWEEQNIHSRAHTLVAWAPLFTVNSQCPLEGHWLFCCITDRNLVWEASKRHLSCNTGKKKASLCLLTACGSLPTSLSRMWMLVVLWIVSVKASEGVQGQTELPTCVLYSFISPLFSK